MFFRQKPVLWISIMRSGRNFANSYEGAFNYHVTAGVQNQLPSLLTIYQLFPYSQDLIPTPYPESD